MKFNMNAQQGLLLYGKPGLPMLDDALSFAREYLHTDKLDIHPDFLLVRPADGKKSMGVDEATQIVSKGALRPAIEKKQIVIIDGIDVMTVPAQNKLLKLLEDVETVLVIAIAYNNKGVLDTIASRLTQYTYFSQRLEDFLVSFNENYPECRNLGTMYYYLTGGCVGLVDQLHSYSDMFIAAITAFERMCMIDLLPAYHLLQEKDSEAITNTPCIPYAIQLMEACVCAELEYSSAGTVSELLNCSDVYTLPQLLHMQELLQDHKARCKYPSYSKDNFFQLIVELVASSINN